MCGLAGIISKDKGLDFSQEIEKMTLLIKHRGPDNTNFYIDKEKGVYLGFNRLSIVDLSPQGNQPIFNEDGSICLIFNGEVYNYRDIREDLLKKGHIFKSHSDSEVVLHSYEEWGKDCIHKFRGIFAFAIWEKKKNKLLLVRDRFGIKPLYYLITDKFLAFASEAKAFMGLGSKFYLSETDEEILQLYLSFSFNPHWEKTIFKGILRLPAAHLAIFQDNTFQKLRYWKLTKDEKIKENSFSEALETVNELLNESVRLSLVADVPVAVTLSGGVDSSLLSAIVKRNNGELTSTFTIGFDYPYDESNYALKVSSYLKTDHHKITYTAQDVIDNLEKIAWFSDALNSLNVIMPYFLSKRLRDNGYKAVLIGDGADEVFGGYHLFKLSQLPFSLLPPRMRSSLYYYFIGAKKISRSSIYFNRFFQDAIDVKQTSNVHNQITQFEIFRQLPNNILLNNDKGMMANSVEARPPYLDHKLVEYVYNLPQRYKIDGLFYNKRNKNLKCILRALAKRYLPDEISKRPKFSSALFSEIYDLVPDKIRSYLFDQPFFIGRIYPRKNVEKLLQIYKFNKTALFVLNKLFFLEVWAKQYLSADRVPQTQSGMGKFKINNNVNI